MQTKTQPREAIKVMKKRRKMTFLLWKRAMRRSLRGVIKLIQAQVREMEAIQVKMKVKREERFHTTLTWKNWTD